jgi:hypothetical protein
MPRTAVGLKDCILRPPGGSYSECEGVGGGGLHRKLSVLWLSQGQRAALTGGVEGNGDTSLLRNHQDSTEDA